MTVPPPVGGGTHRPAASTPARHRPVLGVVVPVHNEQDLLEDCLAALRASVHAVAGRARVATVVALDECSDRSEMIAREYGVGIVRLRARNVGLARRAACAALLRRSEHPVAWLASTDADSQVPSEWLTAHVDALEGGWDAFAGTVRVADWERHPPPTRTWFHEVYENRRDPRSAAPDATHAHVHGANLGVRATSYRAIGGFPALATGEDVALIARLDRRGHPIRRTRAVPVLTSARALGRAPHGFAAHLLRAPEHHQSHAWT